MQNDPFVKNPCRFPDEVRARAPRDLLTDVKSAADREGMPASEFIRRALHEAVERCVPHTVADARQ